MRQIEVFRHYAVMMITLTADERHRWLCNLKLNSFNLMKTVQSVKAVVGRLDAEAQSCHISRPTPCPLLVRGHVRSSARPGGQRPLYSCLYLQKDFRSISASSERLPSAP